MRIMEDLFVCFVGQSQATDVVFAYGLTDTNLKNDVTLARQMSMAIVNQLAENDKVSVGAVRMEDRPVTLFDLVSTKQKNTIFSNLKSAKLSSISYDMRTSLPFIADKVFKLNTDFHFDIPKTLVLFVNQPQDVFVEKKIKELLDNGVKIIAIGVGNKVQLADLLLLVNGNRDMIRIIKTKDDNTDETGVDVIKRPGKKLSILLNYYACYTPFHWLEFTRVE